MRHEACDLREDGAETAGRNRSPVMANELTSSTCVPPGPSAAAAAAAAAAARTRRATWRMRTLERDSCDHCMHVGRRIWLIWLQLLCHGWCRCMAEGSIHTTREYPALHPHSRAKQSVHQQPCLVRVRFVRVRARQGEGCVQAG